MFRHSTSILVILDCAFFCYACVSHALKSYTWNWFTKRMSPGPVGSRRSNAIIVIELSALRWACSLLNENTCMCQCRLIPVSIKLLFGAVSKVTHPGTAMATSTFSHHSSASAVSIETIPTIFYFYLLANFIIIIWIVWWSRIRHDWCWKRIACLLLFYLLK